MKNEKKLVKRSRFLLTDKDSKEKFFAILNIEFKQWKYKRKGDKKGERSGLSLDGNFDLDIIPLHFEGSLNLTRKRGMSLYFENSGNAKTLKATKTLAKLARLRRGFEAVKQGKRKTLINLNTVRNDGSGLILFDPKEGIFTITDCSNVLHFKIDNLKGFQDLVSAIIVQIRMVESQIKDDWLKAI